MDQPAQSFWSIPVPEILRQLGTAPEGLTSEEARQRLIRFGASLLKPRKRAEAQVLPARPGGCGHHPGHRSCQRAARLLAGEGRGERYSEVAGNGANQGQRGA
jgi:hypothetical protein